MPVGLAGLATSTPASGALAMRLLDVLGGERPARIRADRDLHRDQPERLQDVAIGRIGGRGHGDAVARIERAEER